MELADEYGTHRSYTRSQKMWGRGKMWACGFFTRSRPENVGMWIFHVFRECGECGHEVFHVSRNVRMLLFTSPENVRICFFVPRGI
jgi:hypothetical protein